MSEVLAVVVPQVNPNDESAVLVRWHVECGSRVSAGQALVTLETTKATFDVDAPRAGYAFFNHPPKALVAVGAPIAWISDEKQLPRAATAMDADLGVKAAAGESRFSRKALRLMKEHGLSAADFASSGRIEAADVERAARERAAGGSAVAPGDAEPLEQSPTKLLEIEALRGVYQHAIPSTVSISLSCDKVNVRLQGLADEIGPVSLLELAIHEVARVLPDFPDLNGFHAEGRAWAYRSVAVGFALNLGRSLRVPVVRQPAESSQIEIARRVRDLTLKYMRDELSIEDLTGGTFTVTDLSTYGVSHFVPVLNRRQAAILGICAQRDGSSFRELVLTFDHRMSDGMRAAKFLAELRARLETQPTA